MIESVKARYSGGFIVPMEALKHRRRGGPVYNHRREAPALGRGAYQADEVGGRKLEGKQRPRRIEANDLRGSA